jgi:hypothetical protein
MQNSSWRRQPMPFVALWPAATGCLFVFDRFFVHRRSHCCPDISPPTMPGDGSRGMVHPHSYPIPVSAKMLAAAVGPIPGTVQAQLDLLLVGP